ncbi:endonuclease [Sphingobacterium corticibacter]|uniref:Endonuclease n=1 Tax=Sphingobacterium corticibacter TaxID=2171749 RepID=A0A2T8HF89_9SPHI|nr:endonuclease [Sphingobacterium corticibacter]
MSVLFFSSCKKESNVLQGQQDETIYFSSEISGLPRTRAQGTQWDAQDSIGIFMYRKGATLDGSSIVNEGFNKAYQTNGNGNFVAKQAADRLIMPSGTEVDFLAYYPYRRLNNVAPLVDIADQSKPEALDFMVSARTGTSPISGAPVVLSFERQMAKLEFKVAGSDLNGIRAEWIGLASSAVFNLASSTFEAAQTPINVPAHITKNELNETVISWTIFPGQSTAPQKIVFTKANGNAYTWNITPNIEFAKGHRYQYDLTLGTGGEVTPTPTASYMELPIIAAGANEVYSLKMGSGRRNYSMLYNNDYKLAEWVAYPLCDAYLGGLSRTDRWAYDPDPKIQRLFQADLSSGYPNNASLGIDRGHQLPSGDRTANRSENEQTFYYTNMTPQAKTLNQNVWARLEDKVRSWATESGVDTVYVVTGGMATSASNTTLEYVSDNSGRNVVKPKYYYKVLAMKRGTTYYTIGFRFNNVAHASNVNYMNYTASVAELEKETGFTFFPALPDAVKSTINTQIWR